MHPCTEFGVAGSKFTFTGGPHVKTASSPLARAAGTPLERHPQWILSWCSTRVTCEFRICGAPRVTCRAVRKFLVDFHAAARATCHVPPADPRPAPSSFRRFGASIGATPVPIGPAVRALCPKMLEHTTHTHTQTDKHQPPNFFSPTHRRKSSFIRTCYAKALAPFILYDFGIPFVNFGQCASAFDVICGAQTFEGPTLFIFTYFTCFIFNALQIYFLFSNHAWPNIRYLPIKPC